MGAGGKLCAPAEAHSKWAGSAWGSRQQGNRRSWAGEVPEHHFLRDLQAETDFEGLFYIAKENKKVGSMAWDDITGFLLILISGQNVAGF